MVKVLNHLSKHEHIFPTLNPRDLRIHTDGVFVDDFDDSQLLAFIAFLVYDERVARGVQIGFVKVRKGESVRRDIRRLVNVWNVPVSHRDGLWNNILDLLCDETDNGRRASPHLCGPID